MRKRRKVLCALLVLCAAAALLALWWRFVRLHLTRPAMRDAVFLRRVAGLLKEDGKHAAWNEGRGGV